MNATMKGYRSQALQATDQTKYLADRRAGMGDTDAEIQYLARLRQRMSVAKRTKNYADYRRIRSEYDSYQAAKRARFEETDVQPTETEPTGDVSRPDAARVRRARKLVREAVDALTRIDRELAALIGSET